MSPRPPAPDLYQVIVEYADQGRQFAVARILQTQGSTPCQVGTKAVIEAGGRIHGTIGGGMVEAEAQRLAADAIRTGRPLVFDFDLHGDVPAGNGPICGGRVRVLIDPTARQHRAAYAAAAAAGQRREPALLLTAIRGGPEPRVTVQFHAEPTMPSEPGSPSPDTLRAVLQREQPELWMPETPSPKERLEILVEPLLPKPLLVIVGGGHVGQAVAVQANLVGFEIVVIDDRPEFASARAVSRERDGALRPDRPGSRRFSHRRRHVSGHRHAQPPARCRGVGRLPAPKGGLHRHDRQPPQGGPPASGICRFGTGDRRRVRSRARAHRPGHRRRTVPEIATSIVAQLIAVRREPSRRGAERAASPAY